MNDLKSAAIEKTDFFLMSNLSPLFTGLPFVVWISTQGGAHHDIRVNVSRGPKAIADELISVALRPDARVVFGDDLGDEELVSLRKWANLNWDTLLAYWNGEIFTEEAIARLKAI